MTISNIRPAKVKIDLKALDHNLQVVKKYAKQAKIIPVIKSDAYGHGLVVIAQRLEPQVDAIAVSSIGEAQILRQNNIKIPIVALMGFSNKEELQICQQLNISPVIHDISQIKLLEANPLSTLKIWLKFDTGMGRLGFAIEEAEDVFLKLKNIKHLAIDCLMSHLSDADNLNAPKNEQQNKEFIAILKNQKLPKSLLNSGGLLNSKLNRFDWLRIGLMLYGISPIINRTTQDLDLKPVMQLTAPIIAIKEINKGSTVGYGSTWESPKDMEIAIVAIGYGDGFIRNLSNGNAYIAGQKKAILGRISMDSLAIDIDGVKANIGDEVEFWGAQNPIEQIANKADTIPYELLCLVSKINHEYIK